MNNALDGFTATVPHLISAFTAFAALMATIIGLLNRYSLNRQDKVMDKIQTDVDGGNAAMVAVTKGHTDQLADLVKENSDDVKAALHKKINGLQVTVDQLNSEVNRLHAALEAKP